MALYFSLILNLWCKGYPTVECIRKLLSYLLQLHTIQLFFSYNLAFLRSRLLATLCERAKNNTGIAIYKGNNNGNDKENVLVLSLSHCALIVIPLLSTTECDGSFVAVLSSFQLADKDAAKWTFTG